MDVAIATHHLSKTYDRPAGWRRKTGQPKTAVNDVTLEVKPGELFGLLGPNGAGKTTLVKMLCTLVLPSSGSATVAGFSLQESSRIRQAVGLVVSDERSFYWRLSGRQNMRFFASMYGLSGSEGVERVQTLLGEVDMAAEADQPFQTYSTGMRQRLAIARSLLHQPSILFLDEPSRSLDPVATARLHGLIRELIARQQVTVFLITHDLSEAEKLCQRVAVMHRGRIRVIGRPDELRRRLRARTNYVLRIRALSPEAEQALAGLVPDLQVETGQGQKILSFSAGDTDGTLAAVLDCLRDYQVLIDNLEGSPPSLETVFAHYTREGPEIGD